MTAARNRSKIMRDKDKKCSVLDRFCRVHIYIYTQYYIIIKGSLGGETSVLRTFRMSGKELVKERVSKEKELVRERVSQRKS